MKRDTAIAFLSCLVLLVIGGVWLCCLMFGWETGLAFSMFAVGWAGLIVVNEKHKSDKRLAKR